MRVVFCGGGTGGHVYPAVTVASALRRLASAEGLPLELLYVGVRGKRDRELVQREGMDFRDVTAGPLRASSLLGSLQGLFRLAAGTLQSYRLLGQFKPDVVFATGGYGSAGVGIAARLRGLRLLLFEPGPEAGLAVKLLARIADRIAVTIPPARDAMPRHKTEMPGYPVRPAFFLADRDKARRHFGLAATDPVLLVSGASSGANRLNQAIAENLAAYLGAAQLIHLCGPNDEAWLQTLSAALPAELQARYKLHAYLHDDMALALAAADLAVMRSGASVLGELPATCLPAVLVPGEYEGWDQGNNARYLQSEGAAVMLPQSRLSELLLVVTSLLNDTSRLASMREALARLARPDAAAKIAAMIAEMAGVRAGVPA
jgi:UDP-N-acetylglucosamine--N-acetylmuramyl-(pentapeptide) pyrophosphoryl-undecaprenol N-acetylglucosamine transferase